jgi:sulfite exporter TauE/SafE
MTALLAGAAVAGLLGSPHCVGMCGGFASAAGGQAPWHAGRLAAYVVMGAVAGALGAPLWDLRAAGAVVTGSLLVWFCARLAGLAPEVHLRIPGLARIGTRVAARGGLTGRVLLGAFSALLPCGLLWSAVALAIGAGSAASGAAVLLAFGAGTLPALGFAAAGVRRLAAARPWTRRLVAACVLGAGLWSISVRVEAPPASAICHPHH